jgi:hypothetical protein
VTDPAWRSEVRILLLHPDDAAILVYNRDGGLVLPKVRVSERVCLDEPPAIIAAVRRQLGLEIIEFVSAGRGRG